MWGQPPWRLAAPTPGEVRSTQYLAKAEPRGWPVFGLAAGHKAVQGLPGHADVVDAGVPRIVLLLLLHSSPELDLQALSLSGICADQAALCIKSAGEELLHLCRCSALGGRLAQKIA